MTQKMFIMQSTFWVGLCDYMDSYAIKAILLEFLLERKENGKNVNHCLNEKES